MQQEALGFLKECEQINKRHARLAQELEQDIKELNNEIGVEFNRCIESARFLATQEYAQDYNLEELISKIKTISSQGEREAFAFELLLQDFETFARLKEIVGVMSRRLKLEQ